MHNFALEIETPNKFLRHFRTEYHSHELNRTGTLNPNFKSKQFSAIDQFYNSSTIEDSSPKRRIKSLHRSSSASKHHIFQNAKTSIKQDKLRSISVKSLIKTQTLSTTQQKVGKKQLDFVIPNKSNKQKAMIINEKKTVEDIMNRLKNKKQMRLKLTKQIKIDEEKKDKFNAIMSNIEFQFNLNQLSKAEIAINDHKRYEKFQANQQKSTKKQPEHHSILLQKEKQRQKDKQIEEIMKQMLEEKSRSLEQTQTEVDKKLHYIQHMMNNFQQTVKTKEQEFQQKEKILRIKEKQIEIKIKEAAQSIIQNELKRTVSIPPKMELSTSAQKISFEKISPKNRLDTISPKNSSLEDKSKSLYQSPTNRDNSIKDTQERFLYNTIESVNQQSNMVTIQQEDSETDVRKTASFKRYDTSDILDLDHIESISFKAPEEPAKPKVDEKRPLSSKKPIKTVRQPVSYSPHIQENNKLKSNTSINKQEVQVMNMSQQDIRKNMISQQIAKNQTTQTQPSNQISKEPSIKQTQRSFEKSFEKQKQKGIKQNENSKEISRKQSMASSVSEKSENQSAKQKKREQKDRTAQLVKTISRINELVYFIGEIPHHCSNQMKKKKKYQFKLASLYLLKYVFDKFRYLTKICHDLLKKKVIAKEYLQEREEENIRIKESYEKMKSYVYKKEPFPPKECEKYLNENSPSLCMEDPHFIKGFMFRQIKEIINFYYEDTKGKWTDHQVNLCYYRMFLAVFILEEIQFDNVVLETEDSQYPDYMLGEIENFTEDQLKDKMTECYQIFVDLDLK